MTTATINISYFDGKQTVDIPELGAFYTFHVFYTFHSEAVETKNILRSIRRKCERKYGFTFGRVSKVHETSYDTTYKAQIEELCD